jgi:WD40 repeat protein
VCLFDISALQQQLVQGQPWRQQQQQQPLQPLRTIVGAHDPMACAVAFRGPSKPWQLLSGGVDNRVALWDFSRPKKCCGSWNMAHMAGQHPQLQVQGSAAAGADEQQQHQQQQGQQQQGQLWNPPFVHALALPATAATAEGRGEPATSVLPVPPAVVKRLVAAARGDGVVSVFDADPDAKPVKASSSGGKQAGAAAPPLSHQQAASKGKKAASKSKVAASTPPPAAAQATQGPEQQQQQQQPLALAQVPPGFHVCLDGRFGGHTLAAASVAFMPCGGGHRLLWSGGQDGRLLLWDWAAALSAGGSASGGAAGPLVLDVAHKRKVNALACCWELGASSTGGEQRPVWLLVAGTSRNVNVYRVTGCRA